MMMRSRRSSRKTKIENELESLPPDLVIEILKRLPLKLVSRFLLVSKLCSTIIRSQDFIRSFPFPPSILQPHRLLFALNSLDNTNWLFYLEEEKPALSYLSRTKCQILNRRLSDVHYVNGLISLGYGQQQIITNPSTGKSITLPLVDKSRENIIRSFFGYDPIDFQFKVLLCMSEQVHGYSTVPSCEHQVFTLMGREGRVEQSWRMIECNTPHCPKTNGLCINGVLYYGAYTGTDMLQWCLMRFDVRTEKLDLVSRLNENVQSFRPEHSPSLINYQERVTLAFETSLHTFDLWVMDDAEKWSSIRFTIRPWRRLFGDAALRICGINIHTGEIILVPYGWIITYGVVNYHVVYYDHKRNKFRLRNVALYIGNRIPQTYVMVRLSNYVESAMLL